MATEKLEKEVEKESSGRRVSFKNSFRFYGYSAPLLSALVLGGVLIGSLWNGRINEASIIVDSNRNGVMEDVEYRAACEVIDKEYSPGESFSDRENDAIIQAYHDGKFSSR